MTKLDYLIERAKLDFVSGLELKDLLPVAQAVKKYLELIGYGDCCPCISCRQTLPVRKALAPLLEPAGESEAHTRMAPCAHRRLNEDGICRECGSDQRAA